MLFLNGWNWTFSPSTLHFCCRRPHMGSGPPERTDPFGILIRHHLSTSSEDRLPHHSNDWESFGDTRSNVFHCRVAFVVSWCWVTPKEQYHWNHTLPCHHAPAHNCIYHDTRVIRTIRYVSKDLIHHEAGNMKDRGLRKTMILSAYPIGSTYLLQFQSFFEENNKSILELQVV